MQQQALRDLDQAWRNFFARTHGRPSWRRQRVHEGFRIVGSAAQRLEKLNRKWGRVLVSKVGWVKLRLSRRLPEAKSYRVTRDRAGRWHIAFAVFRCVACRYGANADVNAAVSIARIAVNIAAGRAVNARGETAVLVSEKREPQHAPPTVA